MGNTFQETRYYPKTGKTKQNQIDTLGCKTMKSWVERQPTGTSQREQEMKAKQLPRANACFSALIPSALLTMEKLVELYTLWGLVNFGV